MHLESENKQFSLHIGGIGQIDTVFLIGPQSVFTVPGGGSNGVGNAEATQIRRAILQADGDIFDQFDYSVEFDFANASNDNSGLQPPSFGNLTSSPALAAASGLSCNGADKDGEKDLSTFCPRGVGFADETGISFYRGRGRNQRVRGR